MKNWIKGLIGTDGAAAKGAPAPAPAGPAADAPDYRAETEAAFYRWLTASNGYDAPSEVERRILDLVTRLAGQPGEAANLVPRVPEAIPRILASLGDEDASVGELSRQVAEDVVLVAEVIREANSAYYRPISPVKNVEAAIMMLGQNGLRMLLARIAFRPLIRLQGEGFARQAAPPLWNQSVGCALAASLMAPGLSTGVFESYLAGLMQNVGLMVALRLSDRVCEAHQTGGKVPGSREFGAALFAASRALSGAIADYWAFPPEVGRAIAAAAAPGDIADSQLAQALALGDRIAKLRILIDARVLQEDDALVADGLDAFQRRCLGKLANIDA
ncbi:HDOD domain-containing protein [Massilia sp. 9096]|uniref:HDOD domain-containing protein n=1 Tax=Massilia sp. 9096 TaxID=1500894 RepID=UPI00055F8C5D|nr:HDOD domain-containing protein [Massilia sp. 9096]